MQWRLPIIQLVTGDRLMYRAYDRHLYERPAATPAAEIVPLVGDQLGPRVIVHPLRFCPPLPQGARYVLVKREWPGVRNVLGVGRASSEHATENLAGETKGRSAWGKRGPLSHFADRCDRDYP